MNIMHKTFILSCVEKCTQMSGYYFNIIFPCIYGIGRQYVAQYMHFQRDNNSLLSYKLSTGIQLVD